MNLVVDVGNTRAKAAVFRQEELCSVTHEIDIEDLKTLLAENKPEKVIISSVRDDTADFLEVLNEYDPLVLSHRTALPFSVNYCTPQTLGNDRRAAVAGAQALFPNTNCLIIDCGTCITYDILSKEQGYMGGSISPGLHMRFQALHTFTSGLPLLTPEENVPVTGQNTRDGIESGVIHGIIMEIEGLINHYSSKFVELRVIMCGGDTNFFENKVKARIFAAPELVLRGLNTILHHHA
ncbi:type III pantothenate kinase [Fulvivirga sp. M361]|uniref:type III pantothenate kinase n=1 Tax=Fulvivirga sp. M361 TaxID=2594266 RepID=UPI00117B2949|nr:type III pantothenate kinase [Fulvivirga sp. M361]TRX61334.1 type III pantothenate kinase [Fulvivirga sp. M361]